jgi:hypothetical protein
MTKLIFVDALAGEEPDSSGRPKKKIGSKGSPADAHSFLIQEFPGGK